MQFSISKTPPTEHPQLNSKHPQLMTCTHPPPPVLQRMLDLFKRPNDPKEHNYVYIIPALAMAAAVFSAHSMGIATAPLVHGVGLVASVLCIASIACLAKQATARTGELPFLNTPPLSAAFLSRHLSAT